MTGPAGNPSDRRGRTTAQSGLWSVFRPWRNSCRGSARKHWPAPLRIGLAVFPKG